MGGKTWRIGVLTAALSVGGCAGIGEAGGAAGTFAPVTTETLSVATVRVPEPGFWHGTPERPTGGFEYGIAAALAERFGLGDLEVIEVPFDRIVTGDFGGADLALADITVTPERAERISFSTPYLAAPPAILVRAGAEVADVATAKDLKWAVERGTTLEAALRDLVDPGEPPLVAATETEVVERVDDGHVDAALIDLPVALGYARQSDGRLAVTAQLPSDAVLAIAMPRGSANVEPVDSALRALSSQGEIAALARRWLDSDLEGGRVQQVRVLRTGS
ncbi:MAG: amino acid ABC transporter substrate-binding protein [Thermoleophilaceae bacterium]|nr:amino acid ABC transporter substrate-binding protein [Thermoleophilaceae bacterium]